jgi:hypothetical protein
MVPINHTNPNGPRPHPGGRFFTSGKRRSRLPRTLAEMKEIRLS